MSLQEILSKTMVCAGIVAVGDNDRRACIRKATIAESRVALETKALQGSPVISLICSSDD